jgi:5-methylcytosine-specific restriction protein A
VPTLPKRICKHPGCMVTTVNSTYCEAHKAQHDKDKDRYRKNANDRGYNARWQKVSKLYLKEHPICECDECVKVGRLTTANVVHHVIPHHGNYELFWDQDNWQAMNKRCHDRHTSIEKRKEKTKAINNIQGRGI